MRENRQLAIESYIYKNQEVSMKELQNEFNVSMNTIRADVARLVEAGIVKKIYGGVKYSKAVETFESRLQKDMDLKFQIAEKAASLIESGDTIYIDYGTTTMSIPDLLEGRKDIQIITPNMHVMQNCILKKNIDLIILPGEFYDDVFGVVSENTIHDLQNYHIGKAFMACSGIMTTGEVCSSRYTQAQIKKTVLEITKEKYLLAESLKFDKVKPISYADISEFDAILTDSLVRDEFINICKEHGTRVI